MGKTLPDGGPARSTPQDLARVSAELAQHAPQGLLEELQRQNQELLARPGGAPRPPGRGRRAAQPRAGGDQPRASSPSTPSWTRRPKELQAVSELKIARSSPNMSHEFRTPLNSILSLSGLPPGPQPTATLTAEQEKQVGFIRKAAEGLTDLVNDLLDLAKVEAGKAVIRAEAFEVADLFATLRGTIRPLLAPGSRVAWSSRSPSGIPTLRDRRGQGRADPPELPLQRR